jgi:hypothetical protein
VTTSSRLGTRTALVAVVLGLSCLSACGEPPNGPGPIDPPPPPPVNTAPVIESITASVSRTEVDTDVTVAATVRDAETPVSQLTFAWSADGGTFSGSGASVTWRVAKGATTPVDYAIKLTVTETYGTGQMNTVSSTSSPVRVHDSPAELTAMTLTFLGDFANSSVSPSTCVRNFADSCPGKAAEKQDVEDNREQFLILSSSLRMREVRIGGSGTSAQMRVACGFSSRRLYCKPEDIAKGCRVGDVETVNGECSLTGRYEQNRWWLCDSHFLADPSVSPAFRSFMNPSKP